MWRALRQIIARLWGSRHPGWDPPQDPFAGIRVPRGGRPAGRGSTIAVDEPQPDQFVRAVSGSHDSQRVN
jgi:hypothetical protein